MKTVVVVFGHFKYEDLKYFENIQKELELIGIKIHILGWHYQKYLLSQFKFKKELLSLLDDPGSIKDINSRFVNVNRQIKHWLKIFEIYRDNIIIKIRPDLRFRDLNSFVNTIEDINKKNTINILNISSVSPRILNFVSLKNHFCDWVIIGHSNDLKKFISMKYIDEKKLLYREFRNNRFFMQAKKIQAEQALLNFNIVNKKKGISKLKLKIRTLYFFKIYSTKYKFDIKEYLFSPFSLIRLNSLECFLYNNNLIFFLRLYIPFIRIFGLLVYIIKDYLENSKISRLKI